MSINSSQLRQLWECAIQHKSQNDSEYEKYLIKIVNLRTEDSEEDLKIKEDSLLSLGDLYTKLQKPLEIQSLIKSQKQILNNFPKAKIAKIIKVLIEQVGKIPNTLEIQIELCQYLINWCIEEKRSYLRHRIEIKLSTLLSQKNSFKPALEIIDRILQEVRKADDKHLLVEIQLVESKIYHSLGNMAKAKASLTASRACANSIYCPPLIQAEIDLMNGILLAQDKDYKTAFSYFFESFESLNTHEDYRALNALKYMILVKIMTNSTDEIYQILSGKYGLKYAGIDLEAMKSITLAHKDKSVISFQKALKQYSQQIEQDPIIKHHINALYENLLEQNLFLVVEPYSKVQIDFIAQKINLPLDVVQTKLSEMILDKKIEGTLDQGNGCLIIFDDLKCDDLYNNAMTSISNMNLVCDKLFEKAKLIKS